MTILNSSAYQFFSIHSEQLPGLKATFQEKAKQLNLKGTLLLSSEGINFSLAGTSSALDQFKQALKSNLPNLQKMRYNETYSSDQPFKHLFVKIKKQIISYPDTRIPLEAQAAPYITPKQLKEWLDTNSDIVLLDARNQYEVEKGTFKNTQSLHLKHFRDFPTQLNAVSENLKHKTVVTFCTGGIRCEKASATLLQQGFKKVYQLEGGILSYFKAIGDSHYQGGCFVFDEREVIHAPSASTG